MPRFEIELDEASARALGALAAAQRKPVADVLRTIVLERLQQQPDDTLSPEFQRLVEAVLADNDAVLRRLA